ncbi:arginase family protein [Veillonella seminalis]|jgi:arginase|uniref:arginase family protein n=1 Tax=Veillonella seminalis TaxID=1502943 RepID=UPI0023F0BB5C|nr:arginase family protein [Veillonella seminalis]MBS7078552.1 arginase family protein [Veillonella seminalis]
MEKVHVPVADELTTDKAYEAQTNKAIFAEDILLTQQAAAREILKTKQPRRIITIGGDCSISQVPFDYLHEQYPDNAAILWIDAHPDIMTPKDFDHEHAMVLGNLLGHGAPSFAKTVKAPFKPNQVLYVGLIESGLLPHEKSFITEHSLSYLTPQDLTSAQPVTQWLKDNNIEHVMVHLDLDVLSSADFRSLLCNKPHQGPVEYAVSEMNLANIVQILQAVDEMAEIVGLSIAEYLPRDIINLRNGLSKLDIFK